MTDYRLTVHYRNYAYKQPLVIHCNLIEQGNAINSAFMKLTMFLILTTQGVPHKKIKNNVYC